ncbi:uncharacterized protein LOC122093695 [Macadamia integrifolia]|uniref:uncharacterized protein LOC122093695 n=1 Tax=Macadamia integrifolia TaxID=60698 RepID=UPI001C52CA30|nr:uncharacterized protein LOC122093695 [Macadamia integrifolia]
MSPRARDAYRPILLLLLILLTPLPTAEGFPYGQWRIAFSLAHSLMERVANLRASRGDLVGAARARSIAEKLEGGFRLGFWTRMWSMGLDYMRNYAWRGVEWSEMLGVASEIGKLLRDVNDLSRMKSDKDRAAWVLHNYQRILGVSKSLSRRFLRVFHQSGPLRELVLTIQKEVEEGLLSDCLELGTNDFKGFLQVAKDIASELYSTSERSDL